ncbi:polygalacturonase At1g48100 [Apium graveolens]|uniref:polygalacturonase At1g48100 n=1 Tax=Apium graveolens TaxID=4045 RepID=UPI003D795A9D
MRQNKKISFVLGFLLILVYLTTFSAISTEARRHHGKKSRTHKHKKPRHDHHSTPGHVYNSSNFNILKFGAKGDGVSDDSKALEDAWKAACQVEGAILQIPYNYKFLIKPVTLKGPCMSQLLFQIDGSLLAPPKVGAWPKSSLFQWINFKWIHNFTIQGTGTVDGQGSNWWAAASSTQVAFTQKLSDQKVPYMKPTALRFYESYNVTIRDISLINSPLCHLKFDNSGGVNIDNITIISPETSPNTDGIHLQNTRDVEIQHSNIGCGDDCVSIQTGCSNVHIHHLNCGPGHGISLGGLGKDKSVACVSDIMVDNIIMQNTLYGVRIKTWQGGAGLVKNISFSHIKVSDVKVPIMIDQYYCDKHLCKNQTDAVAITGVKYDQIMGTFSVQPIHLACSNSIPCINVDLTNVQLRPASSKLGYGSGGLQHGGLCWNSYGRSKGPLVPSSMDDCLMRGSGGSGPQRIARSRNENVC